MVYASETSEVAIYTDRISPIFVHSSGRSSPLSNFATCSDFKGSSPLHFRHRNLRPPVLIRVNRIGILHLTHKGGGVFLAILLIRSRREHYRTLSHRQLP
jgi:hypothetical protein